MVPSGAMAGAEFAGTRWTPQVLVVAGTASGLGGHGRSAMRKMPRHWAPAPGAPGVNEAMVAVLAVLSGETFTRDEAGGVAAPGGWGGGLWGGWEKRAARGAAGGAAAPGG